jgi:hypothetical protein
MDDLERIKTQNVVFQPGETIRAENIKIDMLNEPSFSFSYKFALKFIIRDLEEIKFTVREIVKERREYCALDSVNSDAYLQYQFIVKSKQHKAFDGQGQVYVSAYFLDNVRKSLEDGNYILEHDFRTEEYNKKFRISFRVVLLIKNKDAQLIKISREHFNYEIYFKVLSKKREQIVFEDIEVLGKRE